MASNPYFALPLAPWQLPKGAPSLSGPPTKRKRSHDESNFEDEAGDGPDSDLYESELPTDGYGRSLKSEYSSVLSPNERSQYRTAGQPLDEDVPGYPFPHAPISRRNRSETTLATLDQIASAFSPSAPSTGKDTARESLRFQHLRVLSAILHRCVICGDFIRAGRAWGMILRHDFSGHAVDIRTDGQWGVGAEILLRRDGQFQGTTINKATESIPSKASLTESSGYYSKKWFTRKGFEDARKYYERLIIQYPYHQRAPHGINSLDFYPAMFGLWIYVVQEEAKVTINARARKRYREQDGTDSDNAMSGLSDTSEPEDPILPDSSADRADLVEARKIAARMDSLMVSPPFSDNVELLRLRAMVALWIADICRVTSDDGSFRDPRPEADQGGIETTDEELANTGYEGRPDGARTSNTERTVALAQAEEIFKKLRAQGTNAEIGSEGIAT